MSEEERLAFINDFGVVTTIEKHPLSIRNTILCLLQRPKTTIVGGFKQWLRVGHCVKKGERGLAILYPSKRTSRTKRVEAEEADNKRKTKGKSFRLATVFDISQTESLSTPDSSNKAN